MDPGAKSAVENLLLLYENTLDEAPELLENLADYLSQGAKLSGRYHRNFC